jgi:Protein of unknown function (DUF1236)
MMTHRCRGAAALLLVAGLSVAGVSAGVAGPGEPDGTTLSEAVTLTDAQRAKILRAVQRHGVTAPVDKDRVIHEPSKPAAATRSLPATPTGDLTVGTAVPETLPLMPVPESVAVEVPAVRQLSYGVVDGRLLLVDPSTSLVLAEIDR